MPGWNSSAGRLQAAHPQDGTTRPEELPQDENSLLPLSCLYKRSDETFKKQNTGVNMQRDARLMLQPVGDQELVSSCHSAPVLQGAASRSLYIRVRKPCGTGDSFTEISMKKASSHRKYLWE